MRRKITQGPRPRTVPGGRFGDGWPLPSDSNYTFSLYYQLTSSLEKEGFRRQIFLTPVSNNPSHTSVQIEHSSRYVTTYGHMSRYEVQPGKEYCAANQLAEADKPARRLGLPCITFCSSGEEILTRCSFAFWL